MSGTPLEDELKFITASEGPVDIARFMALALGHPRHGYYMTRDPLGARGDFTTAPEISQMFGELIGLWAAHAWERMGRPAPVILAELGPGRGTLMADALRVIARVAPAFAAAIRLHLVETSPALREKQAGMLLANEPQWHETIETMPQGPSIVIANEFFDALPIRQFVHQNGRWHERLVGLDNDRLAFGLSAEPAAAAPAIPLPGGERSTPKAEGEGKEALPAGTLPPRPPAAQPTSPNRGEVWRALPSRVPEGAIFERSDAAAAIMAALAGRIATSAGAVLAIDYGHLESGVGDTLQAMAGHAFVDPLTCIGEADLTAHVDFAALAAIAAARGAQVDILTTQADFLETLGIAARAERLKAGATEAQSAAIDTALARLTDRSERGMGALFKVLAVSGGSANQGSSAG